MAHKTSLVLLNLGDYPIELKLEFQLVRVIRAEVSSVSSRAGGEVSLST